MAAGGAFELVHSGKAVGGDAVELAGDAEAGAGEVEEERDLVGAANERETVDGCVGALEDGVSGSH